VNRRALTTIFEFWNGSGGWGGVGHLLKILNDPLPVLVVSGATNYQQTERYDERAHELSIPDQRHDLKPILGRIASQYVDAAYCYRRNSVVCRSVGRSVTIVSPAETAKPIEVPFGMYNCGSMEAHKCTLALPGEHD